ncbi:unnamed protein product [Urochloa decumbens]|uniref:F-box protein At3g26010-like beta-propeller domain-containing protein n=1 Tax=Urochloa decumbens TaxID=240449 RepID=A0ABC8YU83_9POAL
MDLLCDTIMLEEILPRMKPKPLLRLRATSRRYNALVLNPGFAGRYWPRAGVFLQPAVEHRQGAPPSSVPRFLAAVPARQAVDHHVSAGLDLAKDGMTIVYSAAGGLLLCSRRLPTRPAARYYVFNPVTRQRRALPKLRGLCYKPQCGLLTVAGNGARFQVVVIEEWQVEDVFLELKIFSSDTGRWKAKNLSLSVSISRSLFLPFGFGHDFGRQPVLGPSGAAYWIQRGYDGDEVAIAFQSPTNSLRIIDLPERLVGGGSDRCIIGERHGGGGFRCGIPTRWRAARGRWRTGLASRSCWGRAQTTQPGGGITAASSRLDSTRPMLMSSS